MSGPKIRWNRSLVRAEAARLGAYRTSVLERRHGFGYVQAVDESFRFAVEALRPRKA